MALLVPSLYSFASSVVQIARSTRATAKLSSNAHTEEIRSFLIEKKHDVVDIVGGGSYYKRTQVNAGPESFDLDMLVVFGSSPAQINIRDIYSDVFSAVCDARKRYGVILPPKETPPSVSYTTNNVNYDFLPALLYCDGVYAVPSETLDSWVLSPTKVEKSRLNEACSLVFELRLIIRFLKYIKYKKHLHIPSFLIEEICIAYAQQSSKVNLDDQHLNIFYFNLVAFTDEVIIYLKSGRTDLEAPTAPPPTFHSIDWANRIVLPPPISTATKLSAASVFSEFRSMFLGNPYINVKSWSLWLNTA